VSWFRRRLRDRKAHARRTVTLQLALEAREQLLVAFDALAVGEVLAHVVDAADELDAAIALLGGQVFPYLADEVGSIRPLVVVPDHFPEGMMN
jgi:hypothetical protein